MKESAKSNSKELQGYARQWGASAVPFSILSDASWLQNTQIQEAQRRLDQSAHLRSLMVLAGPNGVGKSMIASNIDYQAVLQGHTVLFTTAGEMLNMLAAQDGDIALRRRLRYYAQPILLVIDEIGYLNYSNRHADLLFEIISRRYEEKSVLVTTNKPFSEWGEVFPNAACVVSLVDRLVHNAEIIQIKGESYRLKEAKERAEQRKKQRAAAKRQSTSKRPSTKGRKGKRT